MLDPVEDKYLILRQSAVQKMRAMEHSDSLTRWLRRQRRLYYCKIGFWLCVGAIVAGLIVLALNTYIRGK